MKDNVTVLFTSVGRRVELLRAFRKAFDTCGLAGQIVGTDRDNLAPALQICDRPVVVPAVNDPSYLPALLDVCSLHSVDLVFPLIDPDIPVLTAAATSFGAVGARAVVVGQEAASIAQDKAKTMELFERIGVRRPASWIPGITPLNAVEYPAYIKPRGGSAAQHTYEVDSLEELAFYAKRVPDPIVQEYLPGPEITCDLAYSFEGELLGMCQRQRIAVRSGEVLKGVTVWVEEVAEGCMKVGEALRAQGPITIQCMYKDGVPHFTEINARFGGGVPLAIAAGVDFPSWYLLLGAGLRPDIPPPGTYARGLFLTRFDESFFLTEDLLPSA